MEKILLSNEKEIISKVNDIYNLRNSAEFLYKSNFGILILLDFIKANDWPLKDEPLKNDETKKIPILWAFFHAHNHRDVVINYDIHPMKCFPTRYIKNNNNSSSYPVSINNEVRNDVEITSGGCSYLVHVNKREYIIFEVNPKYCSVFGLPNDCYDSEFETRMKQCLAKFKDLDCWCFKKTAYMEKHIEDILDLKYMKKEFLPTKHFFYSDPASKFLKAIFSSSKLKSLEEEYFYPSGKELIEEMDFSNKYGFRYEEEAIYFIIKRLIFEFIRETLLLQNRNEFSSFVSEDLLFDFKKNTEIISEIENITKRIEKETNIYLSQLYNSIRKNNTFDKDRFKRSRFLVMDVEYMPVTYPTKREDTFNFPCIFSNIIWEGVRKGFTTRINIFSIPCHICKEYCKEFRKNTIKFDCINIGEEFIINQLSLIENLLVAYNGFKIYTYGKSDIYQIEKAEYFFSDSDEYFKFERKNRKKLMRLVEISEDLAFKDTKLEEVEVKILMKWLQGWFRRSNHINKNTRFMTRYGTDDWCNRYKEAIQACVDDSVSTLLLLIHEQYLKEEE